MSRRTPAHWSRRGPLALALLAPAGLYAVLTALRRLAYRCGWLASERLPVPVVV
ncbi:MAG TPA: tetraacyldisaccharide 4'-kinase, partial [Plasticicumulans sp.]|nr:tetraacyldisaccharide 4'-kinase [Plasticicumulans sp.]